MTRARKPTRARVTTFVIELESNRARFGNRARIKSSSRPTELNNICSRATELDIDFSGRGREEGEVQIMLDIRLSRGRDNIKNYGEEKNLKKYLVFPVSCFFLSLKQHLDREQLIIEWFPHATSWTILLNFVTQSRF